MTQRGGEPDAHARLREDLIAIHWPLEQIAEEMQRRFADSPLAAYRHALGLSQAEVAARWDQVCDAGGEPAMTGTRISAYERYPAPGTKRPTAGVLAVFAEIYATTPRRLLTPTQYAGLPPQERLLVDRIEHAATSGAEPAPATDVQHATEPGPPRSGQWDIEPAHPPYPPARLGGDRGGVEQHGHLSERALIMAAAHESSEHAGRAETSNVGPATLEQLDADVYRLANDYVHTPPLPLFAEMMRVRRRVYWLLDGHQKPADTAHLYLLAGLLCGLLSNASNDLGYRDAAAEQARAAWAYAEIIGHNGLRAWTRGMQALIEYWSDRPRQALRLARSAQQYADSSTAKTRLLSVEARVHSSMGNLPEATRCIHAVADLDETTPVTDPLHDEIGGVFGFTDAKNHYYTGATYIHLGQADQALHATRRCLELYAAGPPAARSYGAEALAHVDAATAHLLKGQLDGATDALQAVFALPADKRIAQLDERLTNLRRRLAAGTYRDAAEARDLDERIEAFTTDTVVRELPPPGSAR